MKIRIYDYANNAVNIEMPDKPIKRIYVRILTGDETGTILFEDGTQLGFDASGKRCPNFLDGSYFVEGDDIWRWLEFRPPAGCTASYARQEMFREKR